MNPQSKSDYNNKNDDSNSRRTKAIATAILIAGIIVGAALVSGPFFFIGSSSYPQAMAQQNNKTTPSDVNGSTSAGGGDSATTIGGSNVQSSACAETHTGGTFDKGVTVGGTGAADDYDADSEGEDSAATTSTTNVTSTTTAEVGGGNQSTAELRDFIEEACIALQVDDRQGALMYLDMALNGLGGDGTHGNITSTPSGITNGTTATDEG
jgi:hypothetical protein